MELAVPSLRSIFAPVPDPRKARGRRHPWGALLLLLVVGLLSGANSQRAVARWGQALPRRWREQLGFTRPQGPRQPTLQRVLASIAVPQLEGGLGAWQ